MIKSLVNSVFYLCFAIALSSCGTLLKSSTEYWDAVAQAKKEPSSPATRTAFEKACGHGVQAACLHIDSNRSGLKLARIPVFQGATGPTNTQINVLTEKSRPVEVLLWNETSGEYVAPAIAPAIATKDFSPYTIINFKFDGLKPEVLYRLEIVNQQGMLLDFRHFKTLAATGQFKFALISCMNDLITDVQETMWAGVVAQNPQAMLWIGDEVYADKTAMGNKIADSQQLWERYVETRRRLPIFYVSNLIPTFTIWDDHDSGRGDVAGAKVDLSEPATVFRTFFPQDPISGMLVLGPGLSSEITIADQRFYLLDNRSFRTPDVNPKGMNGKPAPIYKDEDKKIQSHLGDKQEEWLISRLKMSDRPAWIIEGDQFFGGYHPFESYQGSHPKAFANFVKIIRPVKAPLIFASGDRHLSEILKIPREALGYQTYEITSSGIHATVFPGAFAKDPSPNQWVGKDGTYNFSIITSEAKKRGLGLEVNAYGPNTELLYSKKWEVTK